MIESWILSILAISTILYAVVLLITMSIKRRDISGLIGAVIIIIFTVCLILIVIKQCF